MDIDEALQQMRQLRFGSTWEGCVFWAGELTVWYLAQHPSTWTPRQNHSQAAGTALSYVNLVTACALHSAAVTEHMDAPDGSQLLAVPLASAAGLLGQDQVLNTLVSAAPPDERLVDALHDLRVSLEDTQRSGNAEFIVQQARDSLTAHTELGRTVGDRLHAVVDTRHAFRAALRQERPAGQIADPDVAVYDHAEDLEQHADAVNTLQALLRADQSAGTEDPRRTRDFLLRSAALYDRYALAMDDFASDDVLIEALAAANNLVAWDRRHRCSAGPVPAADSRWSARPRSYVRQEYRAHLDWVRQEFLL
ncbi:hypothetical protein ABZ023_34435 [Streptomyces sp. NPDC006367]|uniref:hypothetical protein n=1 Tax=unclassified Streptomyces TaxID=2593676 RepID=UPI0033A0D98E